MSRLMVLVLLIAALLVGAWFWTGGDPARLLPRGGGGDAVRDEATVPADAGAAPDQADPAKADQAAEAAGSAADAAADAAAKAADAAAEAQGAADSAPVAPASEAARAAEAAAEQAIEAADQAAEAAARADREAASGDAGDTVAATRAASAAADDAAGATHTAAQAAASAEDIQRLLTPEGFDAARVAALIDASALAPAQKTTLKAVVTAARGNPDLLRSALEQVKAVMP